MLCYISELSGSCILKQKFIQLRHGQDVSADIWIDLLHLRSPAPISSQKLKSVFQFFFKYKKSEKSPCMCIQYLHSMQIFVRKICQFVFRNLCVGDLFFLQSPQSTRMHVLASKLADTCFNTSCICVIYFKNSQNVDFF